MIDWHKLIRTPFGARIDTLLAESDLVRHGRFPSRYRVTPTQYLDVFVDPEDGHLRYCGFAWFASEGAVRVVYLRDGGAAIGPADSPPPVLLPEPGMLNADAIAEYGRRASSETFARYIDLTHQIRF